MLPAAATIIGAGISTLGNLGTTALGASFTREDRRQNYMYNEMAAENADRRTRALYNDFYSPTALLKQYQEGGLSPSMMFGGTPGQGGMSGAQGSGSSGLQTAIQPISLGEAAQAAALFAQAEKTKEETKTERGENAKGAALLANIGADTGNKEAQTRLTGLTSDWQEIENLYQRPLKDLEISQVEETINLLNWQAEGAKYAAKKAKLEYIWNKDIFDSGVNPFKEQVANVIADTLLKGAEKDLTTEQERKVKQEVQYMIDDIFIRTMHLNNETFMQDFDANLKKAQEEYYKRSKEIMGNVTNQDKFNKWMDIGKSILHTGATIGSLYFLKGAGAGTKIIATPTAMPYRGIDAYGNTIR